MDLSPRSEAATEVWGGITGIRTALDIMITILCTGDLLTASRKADASRMIILNIHLIILQTTNLREGGRAASMGTRETEGEAVILGEGEPGSKSLFVGE